MPAGEGPEAVVQRVVVRLRAHLPGDELVLGGAGAREAPRDEVGPRAADAVLDEVGGEGGEHEGDCEAEEGDVEEVEARGGAEVLGGGEEGVEGDDEEGEADAVGEQHGHGDALDLGVGVLDVAVVEAFGGLVCASFCCGWGGGCLYLNMRWKGSKKVMARFCSASRSTPSQSGA